MFETDELLISAIKAEFVKPAADEAGPSSSPSSSPKGKSYADVAAAAAATKPDAPHSSPKVLSPASGKVSSPRPATPASSSDDEPANEEPVPFKPVKRKSNSKGTTTSSKNPRSVAAAAVKSLSRMSASSAWPKAYAFTAAAQATLCPNA